ncbi:hypothetical protein ACFL51_00335 [Myxococcota bacterium]
MSDVKKQPKKAVAEQRSSFWLRFWHPDPSTGEPRFRGIKILLTAGLGLVLAFPILRVVLEIGCIFGLNVSSNFRSSTPWPIVSAMATAPVLVLLWYWRDDLKRRDLAERRRQNDLRHQEVMQQSRANDISDKQYQLRKLEIEYESDRQAKEDLAVTESKLAPGHDAEKKLYKDAKLVLQESDSPNARLEAIVKLSSLAENETWRGPVSYLFRSLLRSAEGEERKRLRRALFEFDFGWSTMHEEAVTRLNELARRSHPSDREIEAAKEKLAVLAQLAAISSEDAPTILQFINDWTQGPISDRMLNAIQANLEETKNRVATFVDKKQG